LNCKPLVCGAEKLIKELILVFDFNCNTMFLASPAYSEVKGGKLKKSKLIEQLEEAGLIDKDLTIAAKHSKLKGLLNPISIAGGLDNPLVEVEYRGRQSNVILTSQGESTLKIFG
jgi:hypothetical protein